jgi:1,4-dihydroxy-2-naphthoate octaprenyltransferase
VLFFAVGLGIQIIEGSWQSTLAYAGAMVFGLGYSLKPMHFKVRGAWGIFAYSLACALAYAVVPFFWTGAELIWLAILFPVVMLDKWVNLHFHQIIDYDADLGRGIATLAVRSGKAKARIWLKTVSTSSSIVFVVVFLFIIREFPTEWFVLTFLLGAVVLAGSFLITRITKSRASETTSLVQELSWFYLGTTLALFRMLPLILIFRLGLQDQRMWIPFAVASILLGLESLYNLRYRYE